MLHTSINNSELTHAISKQNQKRNLIINLISKIILLLSCSALPIFSNANECTPKFLIISDYDDTIKIFRHTPYLFNSINRIYEGVISRRLNPGFDILYRELYQNSISSLPDKCIDKGQIEIVTASPSIVKFAINDLLIMYDFPPFYISAKPLLKHTQNFKIEQIQKIIDKNNPQNIVLIGDNRDADPLVYQKIKEKNSDIPITIYIHEIKNKKKTAYPKKMDHQIYIQNAFDIAIYEYLQGRLVFEVVKNVGLHILTHQQNLRELDDAFNDSSNDLFLQELANHSEFFKEPLPENKIMRLLNLKNEIQRQQLIYQQY